MLLCLVRAPCYIDALLTLLKEGGKTLAEHAQSKNGIPIIVERCIDFVETHGLCFVLIGQDVS